MKLGISSFPKSQIMVCATLALAIAQTADAKPFFTGIGFLPGGDKSVAASVTRDGMYVGGTSNSASGDSNAVRWSLKNKRLKNLGVVSGYHGATIAAMSAGAKTMVGATYDMNSGTMQAAKWSGGKGKAMGYLPGGFFSRADGVSENGAVIVGSSTTQEGFRAYRWTKKEGMVNLGELGGIHESVAWGVSADGNVVVGYTSTPGTDTSAFRWTPESGMVALPNTNKADRSVAIRVSADGNITVGYCMTGEVVQACRWEGEQTPDALGTLPGFDNTVLMATSGDGSVAVGRAFSFDPVTRGISKQTAVIWDTAHGLRALQDALETDYGLDTSGWAFFMANDISANGQVIVGYGQDPAGSTEGWVTKLK